MYIRRAERASVPSPSFERQAEATPGGSVLDEGVEACECNRLCIIKDHLQMVTSDETAASGKIARSSQ